MKYCTKLTFKTKLDADIEKNKMNPHLTKQLTYSYECHECGKYHLTSKNNRIKKMSHINRSKIKKKFEHFTQKVITKLINHNKLIY